MVLATRASMLIAMAGEDSWARDLAGSLTPLPIDLHWSRSEPQAMEVAANGGIHVAVLDGEFAGGGVLSLLRRFRQVGVSASCVLVCDRPDERLLRDALELDVFSVLTRTDVELLRPTVMKAFRRVYPWEWTRSDPVN